MSTPTKSSASLNDAAARTSKPDASGPPSTNGDFSAPPPDARPQDGSGDPSHETASHAREADGRFAKGNRGGPGNPYARQVAELRKRMLNAVKPEDLEEIMVAMARKAKEGNVQAAKLVVSYVVGKPLESLNPDRIDQDEWRNMQEDSDMMRQIDLLINTPEPALAIGLGRSLRMAGTQKWHEEMLDRFEHPEKYREEIPELVVPRKPKANGKNGRKERVAAGCPVADSHGADFGHPPGGAEQISVFGSAPSTNGKSKR